RPPPRHQQSRHPPRGSARAYSGDLGLRATGWQANLGRVVARSPKRRLTVELCVSVVGLAALAWAVRADTPWFERHVLETYCVTGPGDERIVLGARLVGAGLGALLLIV